MSLLHVRRRDVLLGAGGFTLAQLVGCAGKPADTPATAKNAATVTPPPAVKPGLVLAYFGQFGVDENLMREGLAAALAKGADRADLYFEHKVTTYLTLEDGEVNRAYTAVDLGVGVRAVKGDQTGYGYTEELTVDAIRRAGQTAASVASGPARSAPAAFDVGPLPKRYTAKVPWDTVKADQRLPLLARIDAETRAADARIKKVRASMADDYGAILVVDHEGRVFEDVIPNTSLYVNCTAEDKGRRETNGHNVAARAGLEFYTDDRMARLIKEAARSTIVLFDSTPAPLGEMQVVLAPGASGILLHEAIGHGMEADFNRKNASIYADRINKPIAKPIVSIVDDGTIDFARGAINVDDEGNPAEKTVLVDKGTLATYLHDSISAKHYGVKSTGSGRRESFRHAPLPRMRATYMLPGPHTEEEIIKSVKKGVYCSKFTNGQVQIGAGDFTFYVKNGFLIEDGKLTKPVTDVNLIGNGPKVLEQVDMVANKLEFDEGGWTCGKAGQSVPVSLGMPAVRVASITVGGRKA
ncbi:MAG: TldD/PmbA family protein [Labilithrix sp.]|nr:TldD/PmbA family protein [Labilithrix sp.]MCW5816502.1 TldD/PmbA family protein [Labilithrix sp.]